MSNRRIVSYEKLDQSIRKMTKSNYPDGFDGQTFNLRLPTSKGGVQVRSDSKRTTSNTWSRSALPSKASTTP